MNVDSERVFSSNSYQNKIKKYFNNATTNAINFYPLLLHVNTVIIHRPH